MGRLAPLRGNDTSVREWVIRDFSHGLDSLSPGLLPDGAAVDMDNAQCHERGLCGERGLAAMHPTAADQPLTTLMIYGQGAAQRLLAADCEGSIYELVNGQLVLYRENYFTDTPLVWLCYQNQGNEVLILGGPSDGLFEYRGVLLKYYRDAPGARALVLHKERLWVLPESDPMAVQCSAEMDPENWNQSLTEGALIRLMTWDGTVCTGLKVVFDDIVVAKENSLWRIWGSDPTNYQVSPLYTSRGVIAPRSMAVCDNGMAFLCSEGVFFFDGIRTVPLQTGRLLPWLVTITPEHVGCACGIYHQGDYYLALPLDGATRNNAVLRYHFATGTWTLRRGMHITDWLSTSHTLYCTTSEGFIAKYGVGTTILGQPAPLRWRGAKRGLDDPARVKQLQQATVMAQGSGRLTLQWQVDSGPRHSTDVQLAPELTSYDIPLYGEGRTFDIALSSDGADVCVPSLRVQAGLLSR